MVAENLFPKVREMLRNREIPYVEANGNRYLVQNDISIFTDNQKPIQKPGKMGNRAFTKTGLKVLFQLLQHSEFILLTQRELAEKASVAFRNIPQVIDGLKETGYLLPLNH